MAKFVAISGASATGKSTLFESLRNHPELSGAVFLPDIFITVWQDLVDQGHFSEFDDISRDTEFLCIFIQRVINHYNSCIKNYKDSDRLVIIDSSWVDVSVYAIINMWYTHVVKEVQEGLLSQLSIYDDSLSRLYITSYDEDKKKTEKYHVPFKRYNVKYNRPLELQYYELSTNFKNAVSLPSSEIDESVEFIVEDLLNLGYL